MEKIELDTTSQKSQLVEPQVTRKNPLVKILKIFLAFIIVLGIVGGLIVLFLVLPVLRLKEDVLSIVPDAKEAYQKIQVQDFNEAIKKLKTTEEKFSKLNSDYQKVKWVISVPYFSNFYKDGQHLLAAGKYLFESADIVAESLQPYADIIGLEAKEKRQEKKEMTAEERLVLVLDTLDKIQPNLDKIGEKIELAQKEIDQIDPTRYPEKIYNKNVRSKIISVIQMIDGTAKAVVEAKPIAGYLKSLLGMTDERRYLLLFQNDAELRPTGGFLTAYAVFSVSKGNFKNLGAYDIYSLDARFGNRLKAPQPILDYHKNVFNWHLRDMNLSPDFKKSMEVFWENYKKAGGPDVHAIIAVDTKVLVDILKVLGPIGVADWGNFSAETDKRCNCPQVFYELERYADKPVGELRTERKAVIGPLMHSILLNVMQSPRKQWPEFFNVFFTNIQRKHLLFFFLDEKLQGAIEALNAGGRIKEADGDYLHINDCNFAGAKSNMFIKENVVQEIKVDSNGEVTKNITIDYLNPEPPSNCNLEKGDLCLNGLYRDWVRLYVPKGSTLIDSSGSEIAVKTYEDLGKTVFEAFYGDKAPLRPQGKATLTFKYKLPFKMEKGQEYKMLIQKQPGTYGYEYSVKLDGQEKKFDLNSDQEIKLQL